MPQATKKQTSLLTILKVLTSCVLLSFIVFVLVLIHVSPRGAVPGVSYEVVDPKHNFTAQCAEWKLLTEAQSARIAKGSVDTGKGYIREPIPLSQYGPAQQYSEHCGEEENQPW
jgi:hypothetical protein